MLAYWVKLWIWRIECVLAKFRKPIVWRQVTDDDGNRLTLYFYEMPDFRESKVPGAKYPPVGKSYDFHSLVWEKDLGTTWIRKAAIRQRDLATDGIRQWIVDVHSVDPKDGSAIVKFGEGDWEVAYSWRRLDLVAKKVLWQIKKCKTPFDPLD